MLRGFGEMYRPAAGMVGLVDKFTAEIGRASGSIARPVQEPTARDTATPQVSGEASQRVTEEPAAGGVSVPPESRASPAAEPMFTDNLARLDVFDSLNFDFDFDALDAVFGDGTYPCCPGALYDG